MKTFLILAITFLSTSLFSQSSGSYIWTRQIGGNDDEYLIDMTPDNDGNIYCTLTTDSDQLFYGNDLISPNKETYVAKINSDGELIWAFPAYSSYYVQFRIIKVTSDEKLIVLGNFKGTAQIGDTVLVDSTGQYHSSHFFMKLDMEGNFYNVKKITISRFPTTYDMALDDQDNIYFTGMNWDSLMVVNGDTLPSYSQHDLTVLKYNSNGELQWGSHAGTDWWGFTRGRTITIDNENNIIVGGDYHGQIFIYGNDTLTTPNDQYKLIFLKLDSGGNLIWVKLPYGDEQTYCYDVATDNEGNAYFTGHTHGVFNFDTITTSLEYKEQAFIASVSSNGDFNWVKTATPGTGRSSGQSVTCDEDGNIFLTGRFNRGVYFDDFFLSTGFYLDYNGFLAKMNTGGDFIWVMNLYNKAYDDDYYSRKTIVDGNSLYTSGIFTEAENFGGGYFSSYGLNDIYLSKLTEISTFVKPGSFNENISVVSLSGQIRILGLSSEDHFALKVFNTKGQLVSSSEFVNIKTSSFQFDQPNGIYIFKLTNGKSIISKKFFYKAK